MSTEHTVEIVVYRITGRQGFIDIPHRYCEECDLTVQMARKAIDEIGDPAVKLTVKPWMLYFWKPLLRGGWHAPVLTVNGEIFSQGVVPRFEELEMAIRKALMKTTPSSEASRPLS